MFEFNTTVALHRIRPCVIALSGRIGSGKSSIADALSNTLFWRHVSFGGYVRAAAKGKGIPETREMLQQLGESLIAEMGWEQFCTAVLHHAGWQPGETAIIEAIRHMEALPVLHQLVSPLPLIHIYLEVKDEILESRLDQRDGITHDQLTEMEMHPTEIQVKDALYRAADLRVDGEQTQHMIVREIITWIECDRGVEQGFSS